MERKSFGFSIEDSKPALVPLETGSENPETTISHNKTEHAICEDNCKTGASNSLENSSAANLNFSKKLTKEIDFIQKQYNSLEETLLKAKKRANDLLMEKEVLSSEIKKLNDRLELMQSQFVQQQTVLTEREAAEEIIKEVLEQVKLKKSKLEEALEDKEQRLKAALEKMSTLEDCLQSSNDKLNSKHTELQLVLTEREAADEIIKEMLEQVKLKKSKLEEALEDKEQRLKAALEKMSTLEDCLQSSNDKLNSKHTELQLVLTEREASNEKIYELSGRVASLQKYLSSLELSMSKAENNFHSALKDYKDQQEKLAKENLKKYADTVQQDWEGFTVSLEEFTNFAVQELERERKTIEELVKQLETHENSTKCCCIYL